MIKPLQTAYKGKPTAVFYLRIFSKGCPKKVNGDVNIWKFFVDR